MTDEKEKVTVVLLTYGEPALPVFRYQYNYSLRILRRLTVKVAKIPRPFLPLIAAYRGLVRTRLWRKEDFKSPLEHITRDQSEGIRLALRARESCYDFKVLTAHEFSPPLLEQILAELSDSPPDRLLIFPMYLTDCTFTSGLSQELLEVPGVLPDSLPEPKYIGRLTDDEELVELTVRFVIEQSRLRWNDEEMAACGLLLGVHGTLLEGPTGIDTGLEDTQRFYERLAERLSVPFNAVSAGWLNHSMGGEWTNPDLVSAARSMVGNGIQRVVYYPFGFLADNAETALEGATILSRFPELEVHHLPCMNTWQPFIDYLAEKILKALPAQSG